MFLNTTPMLFQNSTFSGIGFPNTNGFSEHESDFYFQCGCVCVCVCENMPKWGHTKTVI